MIVYTIQACHASHVVINLYLQHLIQEVKAEALVESNLERLRKDVNQGKPVPLTKKGGTGVREQPSMELRLGGMQEEDEGSSNDSDDQPEEKDEGVCDRVVAYIHDQ